MAKLNIAPTKSNLLSLKRQLVFAEEGYDLLEQKRQILIFELMSRLTRAQEVEREVLELLRLAYAALREATLDAGSDGLERVAMAVKEAGEVTLASQHLMGMRLPKIAMTVSGADAPYGAVGTSASTDVAMLRFTALLPKLAELAELQNSVMRLSRELRKTQRRCNALSKIFIPMYRQTIDYIAGTLEERDRESLTILKMVRDRLVR
ncbi:MAG TPA: V-type ATP synthase subunit D [Verrucomicrobiae bacterium]|nr:V-type ATP synthase subunit D [Verrucomicrobiae bacterium]